MIEYLAQRTAEHIKQVIPEHPASIAVLKYALQIVINTLGIVLMTILFSSLLGTFQYAMIIMIVFALLRQLTGGYHLQSGVSCIVVSSSLFVALSLVTFSDLYCIIFTCMSILLILIFAPSNIHKQSRIPKKYYSLLKIAGCLLVATNLYVLSVPFALASLAQSVTLIRRR
ncbi:accessory gene regulator B family protein [Paenibacillus hunanensis]|uniref:accessory gene regulator ArgB-like protein n=1 Tax=Paenibacillus hunanensis TaxID=539262 RepID=UPI002026BD31|nr:accessory gene regulator B family protein [Paenibacillus hunanensis]MCL9660467.1 accessory gene regulator B family protein [Paenibacillus hunanensis]WPP42886.1 accessory gene regulator B family protein [Paenibacillus hunanensis]